MHFLFPLSALGFPLIGCLVGFFVFGPFVGLGVWVSLVFLWFLGVVSGFVLGVSWAVLCILFVYLEALCAIFWYITHYL
jgi:hypothetical protein